MIGRRYATCFQRASTGSSLIPRPAGLPGSRRPTPAGNSPRNWRNYAHSLLVVDEVGYIPFDQDAANLFFQLASSRYEHASMILTSNLPFARWGDVFGDLTIASAMIDRIVHHTDVISLKGNSCRLRKHQPAAGTAQ
jgi:hypothetical protein